MKLGTHVPDGERRKPIDNEVSSTKVKVTKLIPIMLPEIDIENGASI
jgi:hypothetical protein